MIFDNRTTFADNVASGAAANVIVGSVLDIASTGVDGNVDDNVGGNRDIGNGQPLYLTLVATEAYVGTSNSDNIVFKLVSGSSTGITDTMVTHLTIPTFTYGLGTDTLPGGTNLGKVIYQGPVPSEGTVYKRYVGILESVTGATTTGKVTAFLSLDPNAYKYYPQGSVNLS